MGSTTATTTSPPAYAPTQRIQQIPAVLRLSDGALLTRPHRPGSAPNSAPGAPPSPAPARPAATSEPPAKRIRLDPETVNDARLQNCFRNQVFPHVDAELATLPRNRVNVLALGRQVSATCAAIPSHVSLCLVPLALSASNARSARSSSRS